MKLDQISEAYIDMLQKEEILFEETYQLKSHWASKVAEKHPDAKIEVEDGVHIARKSGNIVGAFKYNKGMSTSGTGHVQGENQR